MSESATEKHEARPNRSLRTMLKSAAYGLMNLFGLIALYRFKNRFKIAVLIYHGVMDFDSFNETRPLRYRYSKKDFENCLTCLSRYYQFIDMNKAVSIIAGHEPPIPNALVVTFDDGYKNNFKCALPIMEKHGVPGVFYIATGHVDSGCPFWFDRLDFALQEATNSLDSYVVSGKTIEGKTISRSALRDMYSDLRTSLKEKDHSETEFTREVNLIAQELEEQSGSALSDLTGNLWWEIAAWDDLRSASQSENVLIGSHSVNHTRLSFVVEELVAQEVTESKKKIEQELDLVCEHFAYPNGAYNLTSESQIAKAGYLSAVTTEFGLNSVGDNVFALKRIYPPADFERFELLARVAGFQDTISRVRDAFHTPSNPAKLRG